MVLGLSDEEFYRLTPHQYYVLLKRHENLHKDRRWHAEWLTGVLASTIVNWSMGAPKEPWQPKDFPLRLLRDKDDLKPKRINRKRIAAQIRATLDGWNKRKK